MARSDDPSLTSVHLRRNRRRAFSLLELSIVLAIIAVISAIALPRYASSMDRYRLDAAGRRVVSDLAHARSEARAAGAARTVAFGGTPDTYVLQNVPNPDKGTPYTLVRLADSPYEVRITSVTFDNSLDAGDSHSTVIFDGYGRPDSGGSVVLTRGSLTLAVALDAESGEASVP